MTPAPHAPVNVDEIAAQIERRISAGEYEAGQPLRQEALATEFGVSRTPVREALRKLEAAALVEIVPNRGAIVRTRTVREIRDAYAVRAELEGLAAELAAQFITADEIRELHEAAHLFRRSVARAEQASASRPDRSGSWIEANERFHECILMASGNLPLRRLTNDLNYAFPRRSTWAALHRDLRLLRRNVEEHQAITEAVEAGDAAVARTLMRRHVLKAGAIVAAWAERQPV